MSEFETGSNIETSISLIESALRAHARATQRRPEDVAAIINAGNALRREVLKYERILMEETGWSNPIRHLGPLPPYSHTKGVDGADLTNGPDTVLASVTAEYVVAIDDQWEIETLVEARGGERPDSIVEAIDYLHKCDGWDVTQYPPRRIRLVSHRFDASLIIDQEQHDS